MHPIPTTLCALDDALRLRVRLVGRQPTRRQLSMRAMRCMQLLHAVLPSAVAATIFTQRFA